MSDNAILVTRDEPQQSMADLSKRLEDARNAGVTIKAIADETGINRSSLSTLVNHGAANLTPQAMDKLGNWLDGYEEKRGNVNPVVMGPSHSMAFEHHHHHTGPISIPTFPPVSPAHAHQQAEQMQPITKKASLEIFTTKDYTSAIGFCHDIVESHSIGVVVGVPGTGKTTVARTICEQLPKCLYIEAWKSMRLGDLLDEIGIGLGRQLQGTTTYKIRELVRSLRGSGYTLVIDEAENLKNHQVEKLDVLRKLHDNTGIALLLFGMPLLRNVLNRADVTQLSRRMYTCELQGAKVGEIRKELQAYDIDTEAAEALSRIAADKAHGGMGSYTMMMELCLKAANGGTITMDMLRDARQYKIGLRECS